MEFASTRTLVVAEIHSLALLRPRPKRIADIYFAKTHNKNTLKSSFHVSLSLSEDRESENASERLELDL